jgi:hypothetical protein
MNGHTDVVKALIEKSTDVDAKEKVRRRSCVSAEEGANDQRIVLNRTAGSWRYRA